MVTDGDNWTTSNADGIKYLQVIWKQNRNDMAPKERISMQFGEEINIIAKSFLTCWCNKVLLSTDLR